MRRVSLLRVALAALLVLPLAARTTASAQDTPPDRPNVLIILTDDQRATDTLEAMGKIDRIFGQGGITFSSAYATTPLCCPSRSSIMTGLYAHNHGVSTNNGDGLDTFPQEQTIQAYLQAAGYRTGLFGKYLNKWPINVEPPFFNKWAIYSRGTPYYVGLFNVNGSVRVVSHYSTWYLTHKLRQFVKSTERRDSRPWFAILATSAVHGPAVPARRYSHRHVSRWSGNPAVKEEDRTDKPPLVQGRNHTIKDGRRVRKSVLRTLYSVGDATRGLFWLLRRLDEDDNTLAFFMSDNGEMWAEHGIVGKTYPYTQSIQIPMMLRWPDRITGPVVDSRLAANIDIAPTIVDAVGLDPGAPMDGRSLLAPDNRDHLLLEYWRSPPFPTPDWASLLTHEDQFTEYYDKSGAVTFTEHYNLVDDPWQLQNTFTDLDPLNDPNIVTEHQQLQSDRTCPPGECP